jgi:hypothetical protein
MDKEAKRNILWIGIFAVAMAFVEMMIVYYLRKLYYPGQILFSISTAMPLKGLILEMVREFFTIVMLFSVAYLAGKKFGDKFAYFIYGFAVWDIFYYVWLKIAINWPSSFADWDILFLIPVIWASPWIAPVIVSITLIVLAVAKLNFPREKLNAKERIMLIIAAIMAFITFIWDYGLLFLKTGAGFSGKLTEAIASYVPQNYNWAIFITSLVLAYWAIFSFCRRARRKG